MKICVISTGVFPCPPPGYAGLEMITWLQAKGLAEKGHQVALVAPTGSWCPNVEIISNGPPGNGDERRQYDSYWKRLVEFDVILDHSWNKFSVILKAEGVLKAPSLLWTHAPIRTMFSTPPPIEKPCFVCISEDQARDCMDHLCCDSRVVHNGVDGNFYKSTGAPRSDRYLFLARFSSIKGPGIAQEVCLSTNVGLDMVGDTSITNEPQLYEDCKKRADGKQIKIIGGVSRGECVHWFSQAKCLLHPALPFKEPFGLSVVESQLCGTPVISFDKGAVRETIRHGETGFLVKSKKQIEDLIRTNAVASLDRNKCREWALNFSVENMVNRCEEIALEAYQTGGW